jgi:release factor glutamine methyltransferase
VRLGRTPPDDARRTGEAPTDLVYPPREDSLLLLPFARVAPAGSVLEVGAGRGLVARAAARAGARVVATDLNPHALRALRRESLAEGLDLSVVRTDLARGLGRFDRILSNPPYLPTRADERDPDRWHDLALNGGRDGCRVLARLIRSLPDHLTVSGEAYVVVSSVQSAAGLEAIRTRWAALGGRCEVVAERALEGERLEVWRLTLVAAPRGPSAPAPPLPGPRRGSGGRPRTLRGRPAGSSREPGRGRTRVPDGA